MTKSKKAKTQKKIETQKQKQPWLLGVIIFVFLLVLGVAAHMKPAKAEAADPRYPLLERQAAPAKALQRRHVRRVHHNRATAADANGNNSFGLVTVDTAAGIKITVAREFEPKIRGFIADLVARGYHPRHIICLSFARSHVANSLHFSGRACDFDQSGWGKTAGAMYRVSDLAAKWGLRDGGEFRDWGHIDMGPHLRRAQARHHPFAAYAEIKKGSRQ